MKRNLTALLPVVLMLVLGLSTGSAEEEAAAQTAAEQADSAETSPVCLSSRDIRNFDALADDFVYVEGGSSNRYLFTMDRGCFGLRNANVIAVSDTTSRLCSNSFGRITYREAGRSLRYCRIRSIERVTDKDSARALVKAAREARRKTPEAD
jgi:hypothetical protein